MDLKLAGKRVLITGASKGIGAAAAEAFAEEGCNLRIAARDADALQSLARRLAETHGIDVSIHRVDLRESEDLAALAESAKDVDVLVNNAGDIPAGTLDTLEEPEWRHAWELKVFGYINLTRLVYRNMKARGGGVIVNDLGLAGERFQYDYIAGSTGNAALIAFTRTLGGRSLDDGIRVVGVCPGPVATDRIVTMMKKIAAKNLGDEARFAELMANYPLGRPAHPREVADTMVFLASERSSYTSGATLTIDGGLFART